jgi:tripartite-type tricarboxylate transporter receptor subunit TctC
VRFALAATVVLLATVAGAQAPAFPSRAVRIVVPYSVGLGPDVVAREVADHLSQTWRQPVAVENKPGASGIVALAELRRVAPDGYTLFVADAGSMAVNPLIHRNLPYDVERDVAPITTLFSSTLVVWVASGSRFATLADLLREARANPGRVSYASLGNGHPMHLAVETFARAAGVSLLHVPFREAGALTAAVVNGDVDFTVLGMNAAQGPYRSGKWRPLAVGASARLKDYPDVPTIAQAGGPAVSMRPWAALVGVSGTPPQVLDAIHREALAALRDPAVRARIETFGFDVLGGSPGELVELIESDRRTYAPLVESGAVRAD